MHDRVPKVEVKVEEWKLPNMRCTDQPDQEIRHISAVDEIRGGRADGYMMLVETEVASTQGSKGRVQYVYPVSNEGNIEKALFLFDRGCRIWKFRNLNFIYAR